MRRTALATILASALLLGGCGDDDVDPNADPSATPTVSTSQEPTDSSSTEPAVEPATGALMDLERIKMHAPEGWKSSKTISKYHLSAAEPGTFNDVLLGDLVAVGDADIEEDGEIAADIREGSKLQEPVEIAGVEWFHLTGRDDRFVRYEEFGTVHNGSQASIKFTLDDKTPEDEQQQIIASVLASVEWK